MLIGELMAVTAKGGKVSVQAYSPWIATWGNTAIFAYEVLDITGPGAKLDVKVFTKNTESADPGTQKGATSTQTAAGTYSIVDAADLLELVRLEFSLEVDATSSGSGFWTAVSRLRALNPSWKTN